MRGWIWIRYERKSNLIFTGELLRTILLTVGWSHRKFGRFKLAEGTKIRKAISQSIIFLEDSLNLII